MARVVARWTNKESSIESRVVKDALSLYGLHSVKLKVGDGYPDRMFLTRDCPLFIEFKRKDGVAGKRQLEKHIYLRRLGYSCELRDDYEAAMKLILEHLC